MCCERCLAKLRAGKKPCASCRGPLLAAPIRNLALENAAARTNVACPNAGFGCAIGPIPFSRAAEHAGSCSRREVECGCRDKSGNNPCGQAVRLHQLAAHWVEAHGRTMRSAVVIEQNTMSAETDYSWIFTDEWTAGGARVSAISNRFMRPILPPGASKTGRAAAAAAPTAASCVYTLDAVTVGKQVRLGVRSLGMATAPAGLELRGMQLTIGNESAGMRFIAKLSRPLQPHESLADRAPFGRPQSARGSISARDARQGADRAARGGGEAVAAEDFRHAAFRPCRRRSIWRGCCRRGRCQWPQQRGRSKGRRARDAPTLNITYNLVAWAQPRHFERISRS